MAREHVCSAFLCSQRFEGTVFSFISDGSLDLCREVVCLPSDFAVILLRSSSVCL
jgi:hypothetical protein